MLFGQKEVDVTLTVICNPMLHPITKTLEANPSITQEVNRVFLLVEQSAIALLKRNRHIPVKQRHERCYPIGEQLIHEVTIMLQTYLIQLIICSPRRNNTCPRNAETIGIHAVTFEPLHVFLVKIIRPTSDFIGAFILYGARLRMAKSIPYCRRLAILVPCAFDLSCGCCVTPEKIRTQSTFQRC